MPNTKKYRGLLLILLVLLVVIAFINFSLGSVSIPLNDILRHFFSQGGKS